MRNTNEFLQFKKTISPERLTRFVRGPAGKRLFTANATPLNESQIVSSPRNRPLGYEVTDFNYRDVPVPPYSTYNPYLMTDRLQKVNDEMKKIKKPGTAPALATPRDRRENLLL